MWHALPGELLFRDDIDRQRFLQELALVAAQENIRIFARGEMSTHNHLGLQAGENGISGPMQRVGRRYAGAYNRRHGRRGPLVWDRFTSKLVQKEDYLLRLIRYIHRNPVKADIVTIAELDTYPWTGHSAILGNCAATYQDVEFVRSLFGADMLEVRLNLNAFMRDPADDSDPTFEHQDIDPWDPRTLILGSDDFAAEALRRADLIDCRQDEFRRAGVDFEAIASRIADRFGVLREAILHGSLERRVTVARAVVVYLTIADLGISRTWLAQRLGVTAGGITRLHQRGRLAASTFKLESLPESLLRELSAIRQ